MRLSLFPPHAARKNPPISRTLPFGSPPDRGILGKIRDVHLPFLLILLALVSIGFLMLYSVGERDGEPWLSKQMTRFVFSLMIFFIAALCSPRTWIALAYPLYFGGILLLFGVFFFGATGQGAQRWLDLGFARIQPSEPMKIALVLALARYFHCLSFDDIGNIPKLLFPALLILFPALLIINQPDLGTGLLIILIGGVMLFMAGLHIRYFAGVWLATLAAMPFLWSTLHDYQKERVFSFLNPEGDALAAGYHIIQSKIALGAGGLWGHGFMQGTQSHLHFLPESQTDFIFTVLGEEFGLFGTLIVLSLYASLFFLTTRIALRARNHFGRLLALGVGLIIFFHVTINIAMIMGLLPVVGIPLPLISYGGSSMIALMLGLGLIMSVHIHQQAELSRTPATTFW